MLARFRRLRLGHGDEPWRNTLAVFSVIAPVMLFATMVGAYVVTNSRVTKFNTLQYRYNNSLQELLVASAIALAAAVICPLIARRGRAAARIATVFGVVAIAFAVAAVSQLLVDYGAFQWTDYLASLLVIEIVALIASPGPGRGWQLLGRKGLLLLLAMSVVITGSAGLDLAGMVQRSSYNSLWNLANAVDAIAPVLGVALIAVALRWPAGGRLFALFAIPCYLHSGFDLVNNLITRFDPEYWRSGSLMNGIEYLPVVAIAALIAFAAWRSSRRRRPRIPGSTD
jgi:hypothetical protein